MRGEGAIWHSSCCPANLAKAAETAFQLLLTAKPPSGRLNAQVHSLGGLQSNTEHFTWNEESVGCVKVNWSGTRNLAQFLK